VGIGFDGKPLFVSVPANRTVSYENLVDLCLEE
jgi:hypothetical protein